MSPPPQRNDRRARFSNGPDRRGSGRRDRHETGSADWVWGRHAVLAALANPARAPFRRLLLTPENAKAVQRTDHRLLEAAQIQPEIVAAGVIAQTIGQPGAAHQGYALAAAPIEPADIEALAVPAHGVLVMLDQVTDPQNVGAVFRSAAAFGARGVILQDRHAPPLSGSLAKAAAGALDRVASARVVNLARTLDRLSELGWRAVGLASDGPSTIEEALDAAPTVLVLGSEGEGLRRLVAEHCETLARIPMPGGFESLNVSAAAAIALYHAARAAGERR